MPACPTNPEATVDKDDFCTAHGNDCADYAASRREEPTTTAYLSDGRHIDVPRSAAQDWAREAAELDTTIGLADWYTDQGDEREDEIQGKADDDPRCEHHDAETTVRVTNVSQAGSYDASRSHAAVRVCGKRACILDAMAWAERITGENAVWIGADERLHTAPPRADLTGSALDYPINETAAKELMNEDGFATFTIDLDKDEFLEAVGFSNDNNPLEDFVHDQALSFGCTYDSRAELIAIDGDTATIAYTTNVNEALAMSQEG